jgi:methyltransferase-like protein/ubiquinone/menaquinone biosynthesis C-methylase UbiE
VDPFNSYDAVPYWGNPYRETHPDQLATMARLFGLTPPDVDHSRVLELGCSSGANLIPMAVTVPTVTFLGIDLSQRQIDEGQKTIATLGLKNVELRHASIDTINDDHGQFDYIICHGVYSWVPRKIQDHILRICNRNLSANGVAYVSYNTYPGWFMRGMVRRMMKFHARQFSNPQTQLEQARALLDFLFTASSGVDPAYHSLLSRELNILRQCDDSYIYHEHLEEDNEPLFFHEFIKRAEAEGLRYLAEPHLSEMVPVNIPSEIADVLGQVGPDIIEFEQYLDFLKNRTFRRTLLCHAEQIPDRQIGPARLAEFSVASTLKRSGEGPDLLGTAAWEFTTGSDTVTVTSPIHKAALTVLEQAWPASMLCKDLVQAVQSLLDSVTDGKESIRTEWTVIGEFVLQMYLRQFVEISTSPSRFQSVVPEQPHASPYARLQAKAGTIVTNLKHQRVQLGALDHELLCYLDGNRDHHTLKTLLNNAITTGRLTIQNDSGPIPSDERTLALTAELLEHGLSNLARQALLML